MVGLQVSMRRRGVVGMFNALVRGLLWVSEDFKSFFRAFHRMVNIQVALDNNQKGEVWSLDNILLRKQSHEAIYRWYVGDHRKDPHGAIPVLVALIKSQHQEFCFQSHPNHGSSLVLLLPGNTLDGRVQVYKTLVTLQFDGSVLTGTDFVMTLTRLAPSGVVQKSPAKTSRCSVQ